jgi:D-alanine transfer protein
MKRERPPGRVPHLSSALIACLIPLAILCSVRFAAIHLESETIHATAPADFFIKNQGLAIQRAAARSPDILLLYGSSELTADPRPNRAAEFFASERSGFQICPVGKPGATPLTILQRVAALGPDLRDRKIAISVSPSLFLRRELDPPGYAGNFSLEGASAVIFGNAIDFQLKTEIASRLRQFPGTLAKSALLHIAVDRLASGRQIDRFVYSLIWPLGAAQNAALDLQDHFASLLYILSDGKKIPRRELREILRPPETVEADNRAKLKLLASLIQLGPDGFREKVEAAAGWNDLELLFRTLAELRSKALVLSMPLNGTFYDSQGISRPQRQFYYDKMEALARRYGIELMQFEEHDGDAGFQVSHREHPTTEGWVYYDRALDHFFHERE